MLCLWLSQSTRVVRRAILQVGWRKVRRAAGESTTRDGMLMPAEVVAVSTNATVFLVLVAQMVRLVSMALGLEAFVQTHLVLIVVPCTAIQ